MNIIDWAREGAKRINNIYDMKLVVFMGVCLGLIFVKLFPSVINLSIWWYVVLFFLLGARPFYLFFVRR